MSISILTKKQTNFELENSSILTTSMGVTKLNCHLHRAELKIPPWLHNFSLVAPVTWVQFGAVGGKVTTSFKMGPSTYNKCSYSYICVCVYIYLEPKRPLF